MKSRVTVSVAAPLLREAERLARKRGRRTRSAVFEDALRLFVETAKTGDIEASLDAYYGQSSSDERSEERSMVRAFNRSQRRRDLDDEGR